MELCIRMFLFFPPLLLLFCVYCPRAWGYRKEALRFARKERRRKNIVQHQCANEVALSATSLENGRFDQLKKLYDLHKMYLDAQEEEKADKVLEKITKLEVELGLM